MGAPTTDVVVLIILVRNGIHVSLLRHGLVERRVKHEHLWQVGQHGANSLVAFQVCLAVERCEVHILLPFLKHFWRNNLALREASACHDAVACSRNFVEALDGAILSVEQGVKHELDTLSVCGACRLDNLRFTIDFGLQERTLKTDFLDATSGQHALVAHLIELILNGATSAVDN